ncbi:MAG: DUF1553 domain-containing protein [Pirellulales bacterium]|nr:DUF1553 domain-containing protein [Pirellulales bacterium]
MTDCRTSKRYAVWHIPGVMRDSFLLSLLVIGLTTHVSSTVAAADPARTPGPQADGSVVLPNQWSLRPVGRQLTVGDFPVNIAIHPGGEHAVALHCGYGQHELIVLDIAKRSIVSRLAVGEAFYGVTFHANGERLLCSGSSDEVVREFRFERGVLIPADVFPLRPPQERGIPAGIAVSSDGHQLFVANLWGQSVSHVDRSGGEPVIRELSLATTPSSAAAAAPATADPPSTSDAPPTPGDEGTGERSLTKRADQLLEDTDPTLPFPYACVLDEPRGRLYVSLWSQAAVAVIDLERFEEVARWRVEDHPNEMLLSPDGSRLFVANANRNSVSALDPSRGTISETLVANLTPDALPGNTPNSLALSSDGLLYVANATINAVAVFDVEEPGRSRSLGFIPVGWYPTSVRLSTDESRLLVANGKGIISDSNRNGPRPGIAGVPTPDYIGRLFDGTVSFIDLPTSENAFAEQMAAWTAAAYACMPQPPSDETLANLEGHPIPRSKADTSPITHVIYVVKENRTYDQVFGDMPEGRGDPTLCLFPEKVTPNHHALAREFVLLDNFYVESEVSADGHEWSMGAFATDFVEKQWPLSYGHSKKFPYPSEGGFLAARPAGGYIWDRAIAADVSVRSYGEWVANAAKPGDPGKAKTPALEGRFDPFFRSFDMEYSDLDRADRFIEELERFEREGEMPRLQIVRLPNDHTSGTKPGSLTPTSFMAENDLALGRIVEAVSRSAFWPTTAIFIVQDDAQNGSDHIDAHRTVAMVASPYARRGVVDSTLYSTSSMLRTMELILGLDPMSPFDATAMPMFDCFSREPDARPFACRPAEVPLDNLNADTDWGAAASLAMDFSREDAADDLLLNEIVWRSVRGADSPMPPPRRAAFVFVSADEDDDEEDNASNEEKADEPDETETPTDAAAATTEQPLDAAVAITPLPERPSFDRDVMPILTARGCNMGACHGKSGGQNGFALSLFGFDADSDYFAITANARGRRVSFAAPDESLLITKGTAAVPHGGGIRLEPAGPDAEVLRRWIAQGCRRAEPDEPTLSHLTISPEPRSLAAGEELQIRVIAHDSDGSARDVTAITAFSSNEPVVVNVKPDGLLTAGKLPGEASIMARFMGQIATWNTIVPRPGAIEPDAWDRLPVNNLIDELAWEKLRELNVLPSDPVDDATFLRRASLDCIGRLPTADEARAFLADTTPDKRQRLIDALLARPEYADRQANLWADLLRPNPYRVGIKPTLALDTFLRDAFATNLPYDQFVAELLTAEGSVWRNGATVIYRDRRSPDEIVTMASQLFLGVRVECAKCHQHPFEVYGQGDFYGLAAYFSRVGYSGTGLSPPISGGEELVVIKDAGTVTHPLSGEALAPKPLGIEASEDLQQPAAGVDPRQQLIEWLTTPDNPTFAAAGANRIWAELFGIGIVDPVDDFRATNPPSNPALLTALADFFRDSGFDQKQLMALIMKSHLYSLSSMPNATNAGDHRNFSRHYRRRLRAELVADAIDDVTGVSTDYPGTPPGTRAVQIWTHRVGSTFLDVFGRPDPNQDPPCERIGDATVVQALHLMNSGHVHKKVTDDTGRAAALAASDLPPEEIIDELYLTTYARHPSAEEKQAVLPEFSREGATRRSASEDILWALLNTPEFVYGD